MTEQDSAWVDVVDDMRVARRRQALYLGQRARRLAARVHGVARRPASCSSSRRGDFDITQVRAIDEDRRLGVLHRVAGQPDAALPLPRSTRRAVAGGAAHARRSAGTHPIRLRRTHAGRPLLLARSTCRPVTDWSPARSHGGPHAGRTTRSSRRRVGATQARAGEFLPGGRGQWRRARRLGDAARRTSTRPSKYPVLFYVYGEPAGADRDGSLGRED